MYYKAKQKGCYKYKPANEEINMSYKRDISNCDCNNCVFFSVKNCSMDFTSGLVPETDLL